MRQPLSLETRERIRQSLLGRKNGPASPERRARISAALRGKKKSPEHRAAIRASKQNVSDETRRKMSEIRRGKPILATRGANHWRWAGGGTRLEKDRIRKSLEYRTWRTAVFERDNYTCQACGARNGNGHTVRLEADHIKSFKEHPDLRFDTSNGRTLCYPCHRTTPTWGPRKKVA